MFEYKIIATISKDYKELDEFDINNFEKILYNVYSSHKNLFKDNALEILNMYYKDNKSYEQIAKKYKLSIKEVQQNLTNTFNVLKKDKIRKKFLLPKRTEVVVKNYDNLKIEIIDEAYIKNNISLSELNTSISIINFLETNNIKTINDLLTYNYSSLENLPNITNDIFTKIVIATRKWIIKNHYNIKEWPR